jgi:uncharacterized membrane protein YheB (UPF0754 family)
MEEPLWVYVAIPAVAAFIGFVTKLLMIEMIFRPLEFKGPVNPWLGWQGQVPRNAAKMAVTAVRTLQDDLLDPRELIDRFDPDELVRELEGPLYAAIEDITEEVAQQYQPAVWNAMPEGARRALISRVQRQSPRIVERLLADVREHIDVVFDFEHTVVSTLVRDKAKLTNLFRGMGGDTFGFMRRSGLIFGAAIGVVQSVALFITGEELLLPLFGLITGGLTDWLALQMIFRPTKPGFFLFLPWHGRFHKLRPQITRDYAAMMATDILTPAALMEGILTGPMSDRLFALVEREVHRSIDEQVPGLARPLVSAIGGDQLQEIKEGAAERVLSHLPRHMSLATDYAHHHLDLQDLIAERMQLMTDEQYEGLLRPIFKDDEWIVVVLGAVLGFAFGELQLHLMLH